MPLMQILLSTILALCSVPSLYAVTFADVSAFFGADAYEEIINETWHLDAPEHLTITNVSGNITIKTTWKQNTVCLKAVKKSPKKEWLSFITLSAKKRFTNNQFTHLSLESSFQGTNVRGRVDYLLIVPQQMSLHVCAKHGNIIINDAQGELSAIAKRGNIAITNCSKPIIAHAEKSGSVTINKALSSVDVSAVGNITLTETHGSIIAHAEKGSINAQCTTVPTTARMLLTAHSSIDLALPASTNARIRGSTKRGTISSEHALTIQAMTTPLNKEVWKRFQKELVASMGSAEAEITLKSGNNITIAVPKQS